MPPVETEATRSAARDTPEGTLLAGASQTMCTAQVDFRCACRPADRWRLAVDTDTMHFFDLESGDAIGVAANETAPA